MNLFKFLKYKEFVKVNAIDAEKQADNEVNFIFNTAPKEIISQIKGETLDDKKQELRNRLIKSINIVTKYSFDVNMLLNKLSNEIKKKKIDNDTFMTTVANLSSNFLMNSCMLIERETKIDYSKVMTLTIALVQRLINAKNLDEPNGLLRMMPEKEDQNLNKYQNYIG